MSDVSSNFGAVFLSEQKRDLAILFAAIWLFYAKKLGYSVTLDPRGWHFFRVGFLVGVLVKVGFVVGLCVATQQLRSRETAQLCKRVASFSQVLSFVVFVSFCATILPIFGPWAGIYTVFMVLGTRAASRLVCFTDPAKDLALSGLFTTVFYFSLPA